jgi:Ca2+-binding EF-hand superfamily protein
MKVKRMARVGWVVVITGTLMVFTGVGFAQQSASGGGGSRFIQQFDRDGDGKVSKDEFPGPQEHFTSLDVNGDGYIDATEAPKGPHPGMKGGGFIQRFDKDGDGKVSREEFPGPQEHFTSLDVNGDGYIDATEAPKGPHPGMKGGGFIQRFDIDGDGKVSREEFPGPQEHFTSLDVNGDGYIDATEAPKGPPPRVGGAGATGNQ